MSNDNSIKITDLKDKIHDLTEYLHSDICKSCGEIALRLEKYIQELQTILDQNDTNN